MIADVEDFVACIAEGSLEVRDVAAEIHLTALGRTRLRIRLPIDERGLPREETGLLRGRENEIEVVPPAWVLLESASEQIRHHGLGVVRTGVGQQEQALARASKLVQEDAELRVSFNIAREVREDAIEDRAILM